MCMMVRSLVRIEVTPPDESFLLFYRELYFRHLHFNLMTVGPVSVEDRLASWRNFEALFDYLLGAALSVGVAGSLLAEDAQSGHFKIPEGWLCAMVEEYIYQVLLASPPGVCADRGAVPPVFAVPLEDRCLRRGGAPLAEGGPGCLARHARAEASGPLPSAVGNRHDPGEGPAGV